jgi:hypothetical protein
MGRILPFYRTGGVVSGGGGGGGPLGDATVWGSIADWSEFGTIAGPLRNGDRVFVTDLSPGFGFAQYNGADWELVQGFFPTVADLLAFGGGGELIYTTGEAIVGTGDETSVVYYYTGAAWDRMPDPVEYIYAATDWANLPTQDTIQADDEAVVASLGLGNAYGRAVYDGTDWLLSRAWFDTVSDMTAFPELKSVGALASVEASASDDENAVRYQWNGSAWARTAALTAGYAWDITDLTNIDPSGIGATQIGDFARYTDPTTGEVAVYRLRSVPAVGSINLTVWVPASIYGEAGLTIRGYLIGTEAMPASGNSIQGYLVTASGGTASVTTSSGEVVLACTSAGHFANIKSTYVLTEDDRVYVRLNLRLSQAAAVNVSFYHLLYDNGTTKSQFITTQNPTLPSGNAGKYLPTTAAIGLIGSTAMIRSTGTAIGNTAELLEILADGTLEAGSPPNPNFMVNVSRNARPYFSMRRRAQTGTETGQHLLQVLSGAAGAQSASFSYLYFMTY